MKTLKKIIVISGIVCLIVCVLFFVFFSVFKHIKIKDIIEHEIEKQLGIHITIQKLEFSPLLTFIRAEGVTIHNPAGFDERELAYISSINLLWDPVEVMVNKKPAIYLTALNLVRLNIIKNRQGRVNIKELVPVKGESVSQKDETPFYFDILMLSVGDVNYIEYGVNVKKTRKFTIGIKDQVFTNVKDEDAVVRLVIYKAIQNTDIAKLIDLAISPITSGVSDTINSAWGTAKTGVRSVVGIVSLPFKLLFGK